MKTAEDYFREERERDERIAAANRKPVSKKTAEREEEERQRAQRLQVAEDAGFELYKKHKTIPITRVKDGKTFYSKTRACIELYLKPAALTRLISYGDFRVATDEEAIKCIEECSKTVNNAGMNEHNRRTKDEAFERRMAFEGEKRRQKRYEEISKPIMRRSDGQVFLSITEASLKTEQTRYVVEQQIKAGDYLVITQAQARALLKEDYAKVREENWTKRS